MSDALGRDETSSSVTETDANSDTETGVESFHDALENLSLGGDDVLGHVVTPSGNCNNDNNCVTNCGCEETQNVDSTSAKTMEDAEEDARSTDSDDADEIKEDEELILERESRMTVEEKQVYL